MILHYWGIVSLSPKPATLNPGQHKALLTTSRREMSCPPELGHHVPVAKMQTLGSTVSVELDRVSCSQNNNGFRVLLGGPPHPVIVAIRDNKYCIRALLYSYYTTIAGWGVLLRFRVWGKGLKV